MKDTKVHGPTSRLPRFHALAAKERRALLVERGWLTAAQAALLEKGALGAPLLEAVSENVVSRACLPVGLVTNLVVNGIPRLVPMATEEPSIVAACSKAALLAQAGGGVRAKAGCRRVGAQVLVEGGGGDLPSVLRAFCAEVGPELEREIEEAHPALAAAGGGLVSLGTQRFGAPDGHGILVVELDPGDSMGANLANEAADRLARRVVERLPGAEVLAAIVTNHPLGDPAVAEVEIPFGALATRTLSGREVARRVAALSDWACTDPMRRVTHDKGVLNGVLAVFQALYQDTRAAACELLAERGTALPSQGEVLRCSAGRLGPERREVGLRAQDDGCLTGAADGDERHGRGCASSDAPGRCRHPLVVWRLGRTGLRGRFCGHLVCGTAGGTVAHAATTPVFLDLMRVRKASELEEVAASAGLLQNLAALHAIGTEGIRKGHMRLHRRKEEATRRNRDGGGD